MFSHKESYSQLSREELDHGDMPSGSQPSQPDVEMGMYENAQEAGKQVAATDGIGPSAVRGGVIQSTRRRRRISQEANLLTLAQKAVELASLQNVRVSDIS